MFICRAHNTVNRRLDKPIYKTVSECVETLKNATSVKPQAEFRKAYLDYLVKNWSRQTDGEGLMMMGFVRKMIKINNEYLNLRDVKYSDISIQEDNVESQHLFEKAGFELVGKRKEWFQYRGKWIDERMYLLCLER
jgi:hypothetical protein